MILLAGHVHTLSFHYTFTVSVALVCVPLSPPSLREVFIFPHAARFSRGSSVSCRTEVCETVCTFIGVKTCSSRSCGGVLRSSRCTICGQIISGVLLLFCRQGLTSIKAR